MMTFRNWLNSRESVDLLMPMVWKVTTWKKPKANVAKAVLNMLGTKNRVGFLRAISQYAADVVHGSYHDIIDPATQPFEDMCSRLPLGPLA